MDSIARWMLLDISVGTYRPNGSLGIVDLAYIHAPAKKLIIEWRSREESGSFGFTS
jgi:hypothetical protein